MTFLLRLYELGATLAAPVACRLTKTKLSKHGTDSRRFPERAGVATETRPDGSLLWFHAASVGESLSVLRLIEHLGDTYKDMNFLITSGTATSAQIVAKRLPPRTKHQFAPLDSVAYVRRFLDHWRPVGAVFVESELWPNMLRQTARRDIPMALINARISDRSAKKWKRMHRSARTLLSHFTTIHCQDQRTADHLRDLGVMQASAGVNLKSFSGPLPYDATELSRMQEMFKGRPLWLAASTHPGEDEIALNAHRALLSKFPALLLILVPRHPERAVSIEALIAERKLNSARRSTEGRIDGDLQVYLADTLGEMGLWYALSPVTCLCGSFSKVGGHNPYEPAYAGSAVLHGPHYANFRQTYAEMTETNGSIEVKTGQELQKALDDLLSSPQAMREQRDRAHAFALMQDGALDDIAQDLSKALTLR